jgi:hypothetical protein
LVDLPEGKTTSHSPFQFRFSSPGKEGHSGQVSFDDIELIPCASGEFHRSTNFSTNNKVHINQLPRVLHRTSVGVLSKGDVPKHLAMH